MQARARLLLLPQPLGAAHARLLRHGPREERAEHSLERPDRQREQLEDAVRIARRIRELEGERQELHRGPPRARAGGALLREAVTRQRGVERPGVSAADDQRPLAMLHEERGGELGEIAGGVAAEEEERAVAAHGGPLPDAS